jgi:hypothetical protein
LKLGALLAATHLITGSIGKASAREFLFNVQMLNAETGEIEKSVSKSYLTLPLLFDDARNVVASLLLPVRVIPSQYTVMTPESQKSFYFFPVQYGWIYNNGFTVLDLHEIGSGIVVTFGRPLGFQLECTVGYPVVLHVDAIPVSAEDLQLPVTMEGSLGISWLFELGGKFQIQTVAGAHFTEFLTSPRVGVVLPISGSSWVFLDIGPFAEASCIYRFSLDGYVKAGIKAAYFPHVFPGMAGSWGSSGLAILPSVCFGFGRN